MKQSIIISVALGSLVTGAAWAEEAAPVQTGFLSVDYEDFEVIDQPDGVDLRYVVPGAFERLGDYEGVMVDQPEVWIADDSPYKGAKPETLAAIAELIRQTLTERLIQGGYNVVEAPGPKVVYFRIALTDLYLKRKKRGLLGYTPIGAAVKFTTDALKEMLDKLDIIEMALQAEIIDSQSEDVLGAIIIKRGSQQDKETGQKETRMDFDEFNAIVQEYAGRFRCRLDNGKLPKEDWVDCTDPEARGEGTVPG